MNKKLKIALLGGGNGTSITINALKSNTDKYDLSAIISTSDSGGSSGKLRREFNTLPPGDLMRAVLAMSPYDYEILRKIFYNPRFKEVGKLNSHNLGNLFLTLSGAYAKDFLKALSALSQSVDAVGPVFPVTLEPNHLVIELENGKIVRGEKNIDKPRHSRDLKIKKAWLDPVPRAYAPVVKSLKEADYIILGPGSFYTSLVATLMPHGILSTIRKSKSKLIFIANFAVHTDGETGPLRLSDFIIRMEAVLDRPFDYIIFNKFDYNSWRQKKYKEKKWQPVECDKENLRKYKSRLIIADLEKEDDAGMSPFKLGKLLKKILI